MICGLSCYDHKTLIADSKIAGTFGCCQGGGIRVGAGESTVCVVVLVSCYIGLW
jgi:hypothetical protein